MKAHGVDGKDIPNESYAADFWVVESKHGYKSRKPYGERRKNCDRNIKGMLEEDKSVESNPVKRNLSKEGELLGKRLS